MPPRISALHDGETLIVSADVPSVEPHYREATISVVPLRAGGGTRLKILEAFALGRPVVSTSVGCEGLDVIGGEHLFVADTPAAFAESCVTLLRNPGLRRTLTMNARQLAEQRYSWNAIEPQIGELVAELLGGHPTPAAV
jgi:glycosyltransferase involved in cell wall biosynthesis